MDKSALELRKSDKSSVLTDSLDQRMEDYKQSIFKIQANLFQEVSCSFSKKAKETFERVFKEEAKKILSKIKKYEEKKICELEDFLFLMPERTNDLKSMIQEIEEYPLKTITKKVKQLCKKSKINAELVLCFILKIRNAVINTVIKQAIAFETEDFNRFFTSEIMKINVDYYIQNESLKILTPNKYKKYLDIITKSLKAYHADMKCFFKYSRQNFSVVWNFLDYVGQHILALEEMPLHRQTA